MHQQHSQRFVGPRPSVRAANSSLPARCLIALAIVVPSLTAGCKQDDTANGRIPANSGYSLDAQKAILARLDRIEESLDVSEAVQPHDVTSHPSATSSSQRLLKAKEFATDAIAKRTQESLNRALAEIEECGSTDPELQRLQSELDQLVAELDFESQSGQLKSRLRMAKMTADPGARSTCLMQVTAEATQLYSAALLMEPRPAEVVLRPLATAVNQATAELHKAEHEKTRAYQSWALQQRDAFERRFFDQARVEILSHFESFAAPNGTVEWGLLDEFPLFREFLSDKTRTAITSSSLGPDQQRKIYAAVSTWLPTIVKDPKDLDAYAYRVTREAFIKYLLPIDERLLDRPVFHFYSQSYEKAWKKLDDVPDDQRYAAERAIDLKKTTINDIVRGVRS